MTPLSRRSLLGSLAATSVAAVSSGQGNNSSSSRPNVIFFFPDQVRAQELGYNGGQNIPTPNIDRLASQGVVFSNNISSCPLCTPYRAMLQTGRWPTLSGGVMNWINLPPTGQSVADTFARDGYDTAYIGKWHLRAGARAGSLKRDQPVTPAKESEFVPPGPPRHGYRYWAAFNFHAEFAHPFYYRDTPERLYWPGYETDSETDEAISFIRNRPDKSKPFFLMVSPHPPHPPWREDQTPKANLERTPKNLRWRANVKGRRDQSSADPRCYYAMLSNVDDNIGRLTKFLDESGLSDNTIFVFTSDHGEMLASQSRYNKMVPYAEAVNVPLIIRWPRKIQAGTRSDVLVTPIDFYPTLAALSGLATPAIVNGVDFSQHALGQAGPQRDAALMMNFTSDWDYPETMTEWPEWRGVRTKQYTYVKWLNGAEELFDDTVDPYQFRNLVDGVNSPAALGPLRARLSELLRESHDDFFPGDRFASWFTPGRDLVRNALGPIQA